MNNLYITFIFRNKVYVDLHFKIRGQFIEIRLKISRHDTPIFTSDNIFSAILPNHKFHPNMTIINWSTFKSLEHSKTQKVLRMRETSKRKSQANNMAVFLFVHHLSVINQPKKSLFKVAEAEMYFFAKFTHFCYTGTVRWYK